MSIKLAGADGTILKVDGTTFGAAQITARPTEVLSNGAYRYAGVTGTIAAALAAGAEIFQFRWSHASKLAVITKFKARFLPLTLFTAATLTDHTSADLFKVTGWTSNATGGTSVGAANISKMRSTHATSNIGDLRIATTAALGVGVKTIDPSPICNSLRKGNRVNPAAATEEVVMPVSDGLEMDLDVGSGDYPLVFSTNEGFTFKNRTVWPAAGTGMWAFNIAWSEVDDY